jgi:hypothetical protein
LFCWGIGALGPVSFAEAVIAVTDLAKCINFVAVSGEINRGTNATPAKIGCDDLFHRDSKKAVTKGRFTCLNV